MIATVLLTIGLKVVQVRCNFDNTPLFGDYVGYSETLNGACHDYGAQLHGWVITDIPSRILGCVAGAAQSECMDELIKHHP